MSGQEVEPAAVQQLAKVTAPELDRAARLGMWLAAAESGSREQNAMAMSAALRIAYAESLGLPAHAAQEVHLIKGNLTLSAKLCRALAHQHGLRVLRVEQDAESCTAAVVTDSGVELGRTTFTLAQAAKAGIRGDNWTKHPDRMLWARASKRALDDHAPWVTVGVMTDDDLEPVDMPDEETVLVPDEVDGEPFVDGD